MGMRELLPADALHFAATVTKANARLALTHMRQTHPLWGFTTPPLLVC